MSSSLLLLSLDTLYSRSGLIQTTMLSAGPNLDEETVVS
jgi:hypothetical protein